MTQKVLEGIFLPNLSAEESELIWEAVRANKLQENGQGVKELLLALLEDEPEEAPEKDGQVTGLVNYFKNHPEELMKMTGTLGKAAGFISEILRKKQKAG